MALRYTSSSLVLAAILAAYPASLLAQTTQADVHSSPDSGPDEIVVTGHPPIDFALLASTQTIEAEVLLEQARGQIGDTLASLPGISSTSFAPGASRPVMRGLAGDRVSVLVDGLGTIDASSVSVDHAVVLDSLTVEHIDVFYGPAVLIFGGNAIGGAVNALDKRIPREVPETIDATALASYGSAADERYVAGALTVPLAPRLAAHVDASWRKSDDLRVGGYVASPSLRAELIEEAGEELAEGAIDEAEEFAELANLKGRLPNSAARSTIFGAGLAFIDTGGDIGISYQRYDTRYGVPLRPGAGHHHGDEEGAGDEEGGEEEGEAPVSIDLVQDRFDMRASIAPGGLFETLQFRGAYADYRHIEFEGDEVGTTFDSQGFEARVDAVQAERGRWRGRSGVQYSWRALDVDGPEAFVPDYAVERAGLFTLQSVRLSDPLTLEFSGRYENVSVTSGEAGFARDFDLWSGGLGLVFKPARDWTLGANYVRGARAPSPEELLSDGLHVATQAYELGNRDFSAEVANSFEIYARYDGSRGQLSATGFLKDFDDFITALPTGEEVEDFPVFAYAQVPARFTGFEVSGYYDPIVWDGGELRLDASADYVHARLDDIGPAPRIPPLRVRGGAQVHYAGLKLRAEVEWNDRQDRVAAFEEPVASFTLVNLSADWHPFGEEGPLTMILSADNIFDVDARRAASFTRDFVPLPGRDIRVSARVTF